MPATDPVTRAWAIVAVCIAIVVGLLLFGDLR